MEAITIVTVLVNALPHTAVSGSVAAVVVTIDIVKSDYNREKHQHEHSTLWTHMNSNLYESLP